jgi:hypothetical protein
MPYSITTRDGITIQNIPDDMPPDAPELKARVAAIRSGGGSSALAAPPEPSTTVAGLTGAVTRGLALPAAGAALGAAAGAPLAGVGAVPGAVAGAGAATLAQFVGDPIVRLVNSTLGTQFTEPTQAMESLLTRIGVAQPRTEAERIVQATTAGAAGGGGTVALGTTLQRLQGVSPTVTQNVGRVLAQQPTLQLAGGAGAGAGGQIAQEAGLGPLAQIGASLAGGVAGATAAAPRRGPSPGLTASTQEATSRNIPVMTSDVIPPDTFMGRTAQQIGERIPLAGTGPVRAQQQQARIEAVRDTLRQYGATDAAGVSDDIMRDLATKRGDDLSKYAKLKGEVIDRLDAQGTVPVTRATAAIDSQIARLQGLKSEANTPVINILEDWKMSLQGQGLNNIETLRKQIGEAFKAPELSSVRSTGEKALSSVYDPLREDMRDFITRVGERRDVTKWTVANKRLEELAGELDMGTLKSVLRSGKATPESVDRLLFSAKPSEVRQLYSGLTPAGRANARTSILSRAAEKSTFDLEDGSRAFSPEKFNAELKRLQPQIGIFFRNDGSGNHKDQVEGLSRALTLTRRAGQANVTTPTGQQAVPFVAGSFLVDLLGSLGASFTAAGVTGLAARAYESAPVRNLMIKLGKAAPNSPEEAALLRRLVSVVQTQSDQVGPAIQPEDQQ